MSLNDAWAAAYRIWEEVYDNPEDVARAVVREKIAQVMDRLKDNKDV